MSNSATATSRPGLGEVAGQEDVLAPAAADEADHLQMPGDLARDALGKRRRGGRGGLGGGRRRRPAVARAASRRHRRTSPPAGSRCHMRGTSSPHILAGRRRERAVRGGRAAAIVCALMIGTYASAALICAASLLLGRSILAVSGRGSWSWLEPAVGFGAMIAVAGLLVRLPGHRSTAIDRPARAGRDRPGRAADSLPPRRRRGFRRGRCPGAGAGRLDPVRDQRPLGADRGRLQQRPRASPRLERVAEQRLRGQARCRLPARPPRGRDRDSSRSRHRARPGVHRRAAGDHHPHRADRARRAARAGWPPTGAGGDAGRRPLPGRVLLRPGRLQGDGRGPVRARLRDRPAGHPGRFRAGGGERLRALAPLGVLLAGIFFSYSFAGLAWPLAIAALWSLTLPEAAEPWPRARCLRFLARPATLAWIAGLAARRGGARLRRARSGSRAASARSPGPRPTARSPRPRRSGSGPPPTTGSTLPGAPRSPASRSPWRWWRSPPGSSGG